MCVRLNQWPIDRVNRKQRQASCKSEIRNPKSERSLKTSGSVGSISGPSLVLIRTVAARQLVTFACANATAAGVVPGMSLAEARALCTGLAHLDHRPDKDLQALQALARWMVRFSPVVAVEPPDALFLDVTGSERLFSGMDRLLGLATESLSRLKLRHGIAIAPTPGAAWALASRPSDPGKSRAQHRSESSSGSRGARIFDLDQLPAALAPLPVSFLRLGNDLVRTFHSLGIETIGQLVRLPRETLPARFGTTVLKRLDQALGRTPEPLLPIAHFQPVVAGMEFEGGVDSLTDLWQACKHLLKDVLHELHQRGCGARTLVAEFLLNGLPPVTKTIQLSRPTVDLTGLWNLLRCATETVKCGNDGFAGLRLSVPVFERLTLEQLHLLDREAQLAEGEIDYLIERLRVRLGEAAVAFPTPVESHLPEKAVSFATHKRPAVQKKKPRQATAQTSSLLPVSNPAFKLVPPTPVESTHREIKSRPLHLLPEPIEIGCAMMSNELGEDLPISFTHAGEAFNLVHRNGPERITGSWWEGRNKTRDYFDVEDQSGQRFWLFQVDETRKWYLHGKC